MQNVFFPNLANARLLPHYFTMRRFDEDDCGCGAGGGEVYRIGQNSSDDKMPKLATKKSQICIAIAIHPE